MINRHFITKGINADDAPLLVGTDEALNIENLRFTEDGTLTSVKGMLPVNNVLPAGNNTRIGSCVDEARGFVIYFIHNDAGLHRIFLYDTSSGFNYTVLRSEDVDGGLDFQKNKLIESEVVGDYLKFLDSGRVPKSLNLGAAIKGHGSSPIPATWQFTYPILSCEIEGYRRPPAYVPAIEKRHNPGTTLNQLMNESYMFAWQYVSYDGEPSVFSPWSVASLINRDEEDFNYVRVVLNVSEKIPQQVRLVRLIVKKGSDHKCFVANEWDNTVDAYPLLQHNLGSALSFDFYGNLTGEAIDDALSVKPFDSLPLQAKTQAVAKNRYILANTIEGYDTPPATSLQVAPQTVSINATTLDKKLVLIRHSRYVTGDTSQNYYYQAWYVYLTEVVPSGYYLIPSSEMVMPGTTSTPAPPPKPTTIPFTSLVFKGADLLTVVANTRPTASPYTVNQSATPQPDNITVTGLTAEKSDVWKSGGRYRFGVVFYDEALRKCGVATNETLVLDVPYRTYDYLTGVSTVNWTLSNTARLSEIPLWAKYYAVVRTLNLKTRFYAQGLDQDVRYWDKDTDGTWKAAGITYDTTRLAIGIDLRSLTVNGLGYVFQEGDMCVLTSSTGDTFELPVKEVSGYTLLLKAQNVGDVSTKDFIFELYTPHQPTTSEPFFEVGWLYPIDDAGTEDRAYAVEGGLLRSDTFTMPRRYNAVPFSAEGMSPQDTFWQRRDTDAGRPNFITKQGRAVIKGGISFSNTYIPGTQTNGLCSFEALNKEVLPVEGGEITKIQLTSKVQAEGNVLLALTKRGAFSIYLGEAMLSQTTGSTFLAQATGFIGQVNALQGDYGCSHPESVSILDGRVYWFDLYTGAFVSYSNNGLFPISDYKLKAAARDFARALAGLSQSEIEAMGSRPFVFGGVDPYYGEALFSCPTTELNKQNLDDYTDPSIPYPYAFYDGKGKTWVFGYQGDRWTGAHTYQSEGFVTVGNRLFSFENGGLWEHSKNVANSFFGQTNKSSLMVASAAQEPMAVWTNLIVDGTKPDFCHIRTEYPNEQSSDLEAGDWITREGLQYAAILRDRLSPNVEGDVYKKLLSGDAMRGLWVKVWLQWRDATIRTISTTRKPSSGHPMG